MKLRISLVAILWVAAACTSKPESDQLATTAAAPQSSTCTHERTAFRCVKYLRNYDADTITFDIPGVHPLIGDHISVRVAHLDAPEMKGGNVCEKQAARNAKALVEHMLKDAKRIDLINVERDKYFRILAEVIVDGRNLKDILLKNQLAYPYEGGTKQKVDWCSVARMPPGGWKQ